MIRIFTRKGWNKRSRALLGIGVVHRGTVMVLAEVLVARPADTYVMRYRGVSRGLVEYSDILGVPEVLSYSAVVFPVELSAGRWRLEVESAREGVLAWREIEVVDE